MSDKNKVFKYHTNPTSIVCLSILCVVSIVVYLILVYFDNSFSVEVLLNSELTKTDISKYKDIIKWLNVGQSFVIIIMSTFASSIIAGLICKKDNNNLYSSLITNDVFASEDFYTALSKDNKNKVLRNLEQHLYFENSKVKSDMNSYIRDTLCDSRANKVYYYEKCHFNIHCTIYDDHIQKDIVKTMELLPVTKEPTTLKKLFLVSATYTDINDRYDCLKIKYIKINDKTLDDKYFTPANGELSGLDEKIGYNKSQKIYCKKPLDLPQKKPVKVEVKYTTNTPKTDNIYTCRLKHACRRFSLSFHMDIKDGKKYKLKPAAFGFVDDASHTPNHADDNQSLSIVFDNWMFQNDGVFVAISEE